MTVPSTKSKLRLRRGGVEELRKIEDPVEFAIAAADFLGMNPITLPGGFVPDKDILCGMKVEAWSRVKAIPISKVRGRLTVAFADPFDLPAQEEVARWGRGKVWTTVLPKGELSDVLGRMKQAEDAENPALAMENIMKGDDSEVEMGADAQPAESALDATTDAAGEAPVIRMVNTIMVEALKTKASDIHFEAMEKTSRLRYRIDGELVERPAPPKALHNAVVSRIKILSNLDIAEHRVPQDGRFKVKALKKEVDIRVSILPTVHGEKVVMRILDKSNLAPSLKSLGLDPFAQKAMEYAISQPHGIILVTGPTGSGKTTTLYSCLQDLNQPDVNIVTAEDPVEYQLSGINQVHVNALAGLTFASVLRSVLRQDPDIILVGEIRDGETADIAVKAALTGHLVLSTIHTNDAAGAIARIVDMGVPPFLLASSLILAQAQRLYRKLCPVCKQKVQIEPGSLAANFIAEDYFNGYDVYGPVGCPKCNDIGYKGRGALMEVLSITPEVRAAIMHGDTSAQIRDLGIQQGMITLKEGGLMRVREGISSLPAVLEVTGGE